MTKLQKKKLNDKIAKLFTVKQLKEYLQTIPDDTVVGRVGHFGEFIELDNNHFFVRKAKITLSELWDDSNYIEIQVLDLETPDIGPDPD